MGAVVRFKEAGVIKKVVLTLFMIIFIVVSYIFYDQHAMSKPITTTELVNNHNQEDIDSISSYESYDALLARKEKEKEISDLLSEFERINSANVNIESDYSSTSIVLSLSQDLDDLYISDIINMLISEIKNLKKDNIIIIDSKSNIIYLP